MFTVKGGWVSTIRVCIGWIGVHCIGWMGVHNRGMYRVDRCS